MKELDLRIEEKEGYWNLTGNKEHLKQLNEVLNIFKPLYRHYAHEYCGKTKFDFNEILLIKGVDFE